MKLAITFALALLLHLFLGWWASPVAALVGGVWKGRGGWWLGLLALVLSWGALVLYSAFVDADSVGRMLATVGGLLGNLPAFAIVAATLAVGAALGLLGGLAGTQVRLLATR